MFLGLDTATEWVHLALVDGESAWTRRVLTGPDNSASRVLLPLADEILQGAEADRNDIDGVAVCIGPGGFTSLRVGIATAEGLAILGLQTWGFSAFELRALSIANQARRKVVCLVLDGQRSEAFLQHWDIENMRPVEPAVKVPLSELDLAIDGHDWWTPERFCPSATPHVSRSPIILKDEGGAALNALAELCRICPGRPIENPLLPFYLRETDAEVNFPAASAHLKDTHRRGTAR
ncbi:MAG: tRNA (adenosine(37)-N6)-threonylcarbamoyltransferase complex dimerization subunit type 1 TsaB [Holophagales bacterium]|jgi:tRNA threonylcarbamoyladenosine biosynthesis protein TsaB|nr:tRNA (adenosine(37)-N6)-threonylcarbamoyltransferase complex dimerization subunit type 1 TsaB [Holophagales bacterium]